ncbi:hypothetical protein [Melaminivora sp.]
MFSNARKTWVKALFAGLLLFVSSLASAQSDFLALVGTENYSGYKATYSLEALAPTISGDSYTLRTRHSGLSLSRVKIFIPPGTTSLRTSVITYRVAQPARATAKFNQLPIKSAAEVLPDLSGSFDPRRVLGQLVAGQEVTFYSPENSGVLMISAADPDHPFQVATGGYIYLNFFDIPGGQFMSFDTIIEVQKNCYQSWYAQANWGPDSNPRDGDAQTCTGSGGNPTPIPPTLTGINLSAATWAAGQSTTITVTPVPAQAALPACTSSHPSLLPAVQGSDGSTARFLVNAGAVTTTTDVVLTCGGQSKTIKLSATPVVSNIATISPQDVQITADAAGNAVLKVKIKHVDAEIGATRRVNYWVGALLPGGGFFDAEDTWFYLVGNSVANSYQWMWDLAVPSPLLVAFAKDKPLTEVTQELTIPLAFKREEFVPFGFTFHFGYQVSGDVFKKMSYIWNPAQVVQPAQ